MMLILATAHPSTMTAIVYSSAESSMPGSALRRAARLLRLVACVLLASCALNALAACPLEAPRSRVTDPGGVLGDKANALADRLADYQAASGHQVAVLLVPSLGTDMSIEECAVTIFKQWGLGRKGIDDGALLLVAVKERKIRIEVGYGLEGPLTDAQSSRIIHEVIGPLFSRGEYVEGIVRGVDAIIAAIGTEAQRARSRPPESDPRQSGRESENKAVAGAILLFVMLPSLLLGLVGLLVFGIPGGAFAHWMFPDWRGYLLASLIITAWCALRWRLIRQNVRQFHLKESGNETLTWIWHFLAVGIAQPASIQTPTQREDSASSDDGGMSFFSSGDSGSSDSSDSGDSGSDDSGGASGGGGASGDW
ncbi:MAG TPA: TPM domain-containing protein [Telluria sp.]|nr:TPM domain-containing protein [Telluria sp.]